MSKYVLLIQRWTTDSKLGFSVLNCLVICLMCIQTG